MFESTPGPASHSYYSQRLRLHYIDWGNEGAAPLILVHGGRDHCRNWDWVANALRAEYHILAPDLRGHGDSQWMIGGAYAIPEYVYDLAQLIHQRQFERVSIIAHSLGGMISLQFAGIYPEMVDRLVVIEGLGASPNQEAERAAVPVDAQMRNWIDTLRPMSGRLPRRYASLEDAFQRMQTENKHLSPKQARHLTVHGANQNEDGTFSWKFDNYVRAFPPFGLPTEDVHKLWSRIACPVLLVRGTESWASDPLDDGRIAHFGNAESVNVERAGHWVHHDRLGYFLDLVREFFAKHDNAETTAAGA